MRGWVAAAALAGLCACAGPGIGRGSYNLGQGDANYDAIKAATQACEAQGGAIRLKSGYDSRQLSSYDCKIVKAN